MIAKVVLDQILIIAYLVFQINLEFWIKTIVFVKKIILKKMDNVNNVTNFGLFITWFYIYLANLAMEYIQITAILVNLIINFFKDLVFVNKVTIMTNKFMNVINAKFNIA